MPVDRGLQNVRLRVNPEQKARWDAMFVAHKISQQEAICTAIDTMEGFDPMLRAMIFGQVPDTYRGAVARLILERMSAADPPKFDKLLDKAKPVDGRRGKGK